jgi:hypothetical protein
VYAKNSGGGGIHVTPVGLKRKLAEAGRQYNVGTLDSYLNSWEDVFTKGFVPELSKPQRNMTRAFEVMDLTKAVFAMAQKRGYMAKTGDLFTGTSIDAFAKSMFGLDELHAANPDNVLQGRVIHNMLGAGLLMQEGKELPEHMQKFFTNLDAALPEQRHRNAVKNIIRTFRDQQEFKASQAEGAPKWSLLEGSRLDREPDAFDLFVDTTDDGKTYRRERILQPKRASVTPGPDTQFRYTTSIDKLTEAWQSQQRFGPTVDYKAALEEARASYINHYQSALGGSSSPDSIRKALASTESIAVSAREALEQASWKSAAKAPVAIEAKPANIMEQSKNFIKSNWKIGLAGAGLIVAANLISGDDDDYNYIEGMRHAGISGSSRKQNTDFGSGWNALRGLARATETFEEMIATKEFVRARKAATVKQILGKGADGEAVLMEGTFRDTPFNFVRKTGQIGPYEIEALQKASHTNVPDYYGRKKTLFGKTTSIDMEAFDGHRLSDFPASGAALVQPQIEKALEGLNAAGFAHGDTHFGNIIIAKAPGGHKVGLIDLGRSLPVSEAGKARDAEQIASWQRLLVRRDANGGVLTAEMLDSKAGVQFPASSPPKKQSSGGIIGWIKRLGSPIPGRPTSNTSGNIIHGLPESPTASSRRGQNTGGQFESPWQGVIKFGPEFSSSLNRWMRGRMADAVTISNFTKTAQRSFAEAITGNKIASIDPKLLPERLADTRGIFTKAEYHQMRRAERKRLPKFVDKNVRTLPASDSIKYAPEDPHHSVYTKDDGKNALDK